MDEPLSEPPVREVEVIPLPCQHLYRLEDKNETKPRRQGWSIVLVCQCGTQWKLSMNKGAIEAEPIY